MLISIIKIGSYQYQLNINSQNIFLSSRYNDTWQQPKKVLLNGRIEVARIIVELERLKTHCNAHYILRLAGFHIMNKVELCAI